MKRKAYGRDAGLTLRMLLTTSMLGLLYVLFAVALFFVLNAGIVADGGDRRRRWPSSSTSPPTSSP